MQRFWSRYLSECGTSYGRLRLSSLRMDFAAATSVSYSWYTAQDYYGSSSADLHHAIVLLRQRSRVSLQRSSHYSSPLSSSQLSICIATVYIKSLGTRRSRLLDSTNRCSFRRCLSNSEPKRSVRE